jgi:hypothetical protein
MSGNSKPGRDKDPAIRTERSRGDGSGDRCDLDFSVDLSAVDIVLLRTLATGAVLIVDLIEIDNLEAVVCRRPAERDVVGTLAAFEGLADLIDCMRRGNKYSARITRLSGATCTVHVQRVAK